MYYLHIHICKYTPLMSCAHPWFFKELCIWDACHEPWEEPWHRTSPMLQLLLPPEPHLLCWNSVSILTPAINSCFHCLVSQLHLLCPNQLKAQSPLPLPPYPVPLSIHCCALSVTVLSVFFIRRLGYFLFTGSWGLHQNWCFIDA